MKIVLTGSSGYLGSNLMLSLSKSHDVMPVSLVSDDIDNLDEKLISFGPDVVIHCGWGLGNSYKDVSDINQIENISTGCRLIKAISKLKNVTFVGFGSFSEYGTIHDPAKETDIESPVNFYGVSKNSFRVVSKNFCQKMNHKWLWIRPCFVYGKNDVSTRLIPRVFESCLRKIKITLNSCSSVADYLYIDDFCSAVEHLLISETTGVYNVCSGKTHTVRDVIKEIQNITNSHDTIKFDKHLDRENSYSFISGDNEKLKKTGWIASHDMSSGLSETLNHYSKDCEYIL